MKRLSKQKPLNVTSIKGLFILTGWRSITLGFWHIYRLFETSGKILTGKHCLYLMNQNNIAINCSTSLISGSGFVCLYS